jgi:pimeloyl-ACP methyl ester carboxylesterase
MIPTSVRTSRLVPARGPSCATVTAFSALRTSRRPLAPISQPFLIIHGNRDRDTPVGMARNLAKALTEAGKEFVYVEVPAGHMDILGSEATAAIQEAFLAYQLHPEE